MAQRLASSADTLLREALAAFDACLTALARVDEQTRALRQEAETEHSMMRRCLSDIGLPDASEEPAAGLPLANIVGLDHDAINRDELALQQGVIRLDSLQNKLDYLINLMRSGRAHVLGSDAGALASTPWAAAVRAARITAQEDERMRLAREVHDGPAQVLANAILGLDYCELVSARSPDELGAELQRLRTMLREGLIEVRRFMFDLRPAMLATMGLNATLERYIEDYQQTFGLPVNLSLPPHDLAINDETQIVIFRVVQECLQNVQKHAQASVVWVELGQLPDRTVRLRVRDDGRGFDPQRLRPTNRSGVGLLGMEERAALIGGTLKVKSAPGRGTVVTLHLIVHRDQPVAGHGLTTAHAPLPVESLP